MKKGLWPWVRAFIALSFLILLLKNPRVGWEGVQQIVVVMKGVTQSFQQHVPKHPLHQPAKTTGN